MAFKVILSNKKIKKSKSKLYNYNEAQRSSNVVGHFKPLLPKSSGTGKKKDEIKYILHADLFS